MTRKIMFSILLGLVGIVAFGALGFIGMVVISFMSKFPTFYYILLISALILLEIALILSVFKRITSHVWFKKLLTWGLMLCLLLAGGYHLYHRYDDSLIAVNTQDVDLTAYQPFSEKNKLTQLSEPASYHLGSDDPLPRLDGATALYPVYAAFVQAIYPKQTYDPYDYNNPVQGNGTGAAYHNLIGGKVDMIFTAAPSVTQQRLADQNNAKLYLTPIGKEAFVFFVNKNNPVRNLTSGQVKDIYAGNITNWKQVGGKDKPILAFQRPEDSGSQAMLHRWMGDTTVMEPMTETIVSGMGGIMEEVTAYHNYSSAIGFSFHYFTTRMNPEDDIQLLSIDGIYPDAEHIQSGEYTLIAPFYAVTKGRKYTGSLHLSITEDSSARIQLPSAENNSSIYPHLRPFLEWVLSPQGQHMIEETGYFPLEPVDN